MQAEFGFASSVVPYSCVCGNGGGGWVGGEGGKGEWEGYEVGCWVRVGGGEVITGSTAMYA